MLLRAPSARRRQCRRRCLNGLRAVVLRRCPDGTAMAQPARSSNASLFVIARATWRACARALGAGLGCSSRRPRDTSHVHFRMLGPLEVTEGDLTIDIGAPKQRAVLAMLLIDANRVVPVDRLIDRLWGDDPPARAMGSLQAYVSNLRRSLEPNRAAREASGRITTRAPG